MVFGEWVSDSVTRRLELLQTSEFNLSLAYYMEYTLDPVCIAEQLNHPLNWSSKL